LVKLKINKLIEINKHQKSEDIEGVAFYTFETVKKKDKGWKDRMSDNFGSIIKILLLY